MADLFWDDFSMLIDINGEYIRVQVSVYSMFFIPPDKLLLLIQEEGSSPQYPQDYDLFLYDESTDIGTKLVSGDTLLDILTTVFNENKPIESLNLDGYYDGFTFGWVTYSDEHYFVSLNYLYSSPSGFGAIIFQIDSPDDIYVVFESFRDGCYNMVHWTDPSGGYRYGIYAQALAYTAVEDGHTCAVLSKAIKLSPVAANRGFTCVKEIGSAALVWSPYEATLNHNGTLNTNIRVSDHGYELLSLVDLDYEEEYWIPQPPRDTPPFPGYRYKSISAFSASGSGEPEIIINGIHYIRYRWGTGVYVNWNRKQDSVRDNIAGVERQGFISPGGKFLDVNFYYDSSMVGSDIEWDAWRNSHAYNRNNTYIYTSAGVLYNTAEGIKKQSELEAIFTYAPWDPYYYDYHAAGKDELLDIASWDKFAYAASWEGLYYYRAYRAAPIENFTGYLSMVLTDYPTGGGYSRYRQFTFWDIDTIMLSNIEYLPASRVTARVRRAVQLPQRLYVLFQSQLFVLNSTIEYFTKPTSITIDNDYIHIGGEHILNAAPLGTEYFQGAITSERPIYINTLIPEIGTTVDTSAEVSPKYLSVGVSGEAYVKLYSYDSSLVHGTILPQRAMLCSREYTEDISDTLPSGHVYTTAEVGTEVFILGASGDIYTGNTPSSGLASLEWNYWGTIATPVQTSLLYNEEYLFAATPSGAAPLYRTLITGVDFETACSGLPEHVIILDLEEELYADR